MILTANKAQDILNGDLLLSEVDIKKTTVLQDKFDSAMADVMEYIHEAVYLGKNKTIAKHEVFARVVGEPIEILVRRAEVITVLKELGFKCETTDKNVEDGTLTISWN